MTLRYDIIVADGASDPERAEELVRAAREQGDAR
jgi:hypothetical protein